MSEKLRIAIDRYFRSYTAIIPESYIDSLAQTQFEKPDSSSKTSFSQNCYAKPSTY